jgi:hypothetical protein
VAPAWGRAGNGVSEDNRYQIVASYGHANDHQVRRYQRGQVEDHIIANDRAWNVYGCRTFRSRGQGGSGYDPIIFQIVSDAHTGSTDLRARHLPIGRSRGAGTEKQK